MHFHNYISNAEIKETFHDFKGKLWKQVVISIKPGRGPGHAYF